MAKFEEKVVMPRCGIFHSGEQLQLHAGLVSRASVQLEYMIESFSAESLLQSQWAGFVPLIAMISLVRRNGVTLEMSFSNFAKKSCEQEWRSGHV